MADTRMTRPLALDLCQHDVARRHRHDRQVKTFLTELAGQADQRTAQLREMFSATPKRIELKAKKSPKSMPTTSAPQHTPWKQPPIGNDSSDLVAPTRTTMPRVSDKA